MGAGGRPEIGPVVQIRLPEDLVGCVDAERGPVPRAEWLRDLIAEAVARLRGPTAEQLRARADLVAAVAAGQRSSEDLDEEIAWLGVIRALRDEEYLLDIPPDADAMALALTEPSEATRRWDAAYEYARRAVLGSRYWAAAAAEREAMDRVTAGDESDQGQAAT